MRRREEWRGWGGKREIDERGRGESGLACPAEFYYISSPWLTGSIEQNKGKKKKKRNLTKKRQRSNRSSNLTVLSLNLPSLAMFFEQEGESGERRKKKKFECKGT